MHCTVVFFFFFFFFFLSHPHGMWRFPVQGGKWSLRCPPPPQPRAYGGSQSRGPIGAAAASLHHSHGNMGSEPHLRPTSQLMATWILSPLRKIRDGTHILMDTSRILNLPKHNRNSQYTTVLMSAVICECIRLSVGGSVTHFIVFRDLS